MRQDEPTRPVKVTRLRSINVPIDPRTVEELDQRARRAMECDERETQEIPRLEEEP